jgi:polyadenylate-binding protein
MEQSPPAPGAPAVPSPPFASLYVGDLRKDVREEHLFEIFSVVGPIDSIRLFRDRVSRVSLGYAYVNFASAQDAERALETLNYHVINGKPLRIMWKQRDPSLSKPGAGNIFIKNIDASVTPRDLLDTFSQFGNILACKVATTEEGESKGFGFVKYQSLEEAEKAVKYANGQKLTEAQSLALVVGHYVPAEKRQMGRALARARASGGADKAPFQITSLYVKYLDDTVNDDVLRGMFYAYGQVTSAKVEMDRENGISKGFGYVNFSTHEEATKAVLEMNGKTFGSKPLYVCLHMTRDQRLQFLMSQGVRQNGLRQPMHMMPYTMFFPGMMATARGSNRTA